MVVYLDAVIILNYIVDFLLILGTNRMTGFPVGTKAAAAAALFGSGYAAMCLMPGLSFLGNTLWRLVFLGLISVIAFGWNRSTVHRGAAFVLLSMALGGIASGVEAVDFVGVCICAVLLWLLCRIGFQNQTGQRKYVPVELSWQGEKVKLLALHDTGNTLRDPLTGEAVLVCGADVGEELLKLPRSCFSNPAEAVSSGVLKGLRLLPYHAIGQPGGMLLALRLNNVKIGDQVVNPLVAFAPQEIAKGEVYRMLTGGVL